MARRTKSRTPRASGARRPARGGPQKARASGGGASPAARGSAPSPQAVRHGVRADDATTREELERLDRLADLLDSRFRIPGVGWRFGLDTVLGLIPGVGDVATFGPAAYLIWRGRKLGVSNATLARMAANAGVDLAVGSVPVLGDLFDLGFKANRRNIALIKRDLGGRPPR